MADELVVREEAVRGEKPLESVYRRANQEGLCPFDDLDPAVNVPVYPDEVFNFWNVWYRPKPRRGLAVHVILATKSHLRHFDDLTGEGQLEYFRILAMLRRNFGESYALVSRLGGDENRNLNAASVYHLSAHFTISDGLPVSLADIPQPFLSLYLELKGRAPTVDDQMQPLDPLEFMDALRLWLDVARAAEKGLAWPVRELVTKRVAPSS